MDTKETRWSMPKELKENESNNSDGWKSKFDDEMQKINDLRSMGYEESYINRAINLYKRKFKDKPLQIQVLTEIISRLKQRDQTNESVNEVPEDQAATKVNNEYLQYFYVCSYAQNVL